MPHRRPTPIVAVLALLLLLAAACGDGDDGAAEGGGGGGGDLGLVNEGQLTVCSDIPYEPFEFEEDGEYRGYDIDTLREIATRLDLDLQVRVTPFDGILGALAAGDCDLVGSALTITEERAEQVDFTDPYFDADQSLLIPAEAEGEIEGLDDLAGGTIGVQAGTTGEIYAEEEAPDDATIRSYQGAAELFAALEAGQVDAILQDFPVNAYRAEQVDDLVVTERFETDEQYGFAVEQGSDALLERLDETLAELREEGFFDELDREYFGEAADA